jgi:hypothetical protein
MREDRTYGHTDPLTRINVVNAASDLYCSICDSRPCYILLTAAISVVQEQLTEHDCSDTTNLTNAVRYADSLERLHGCLARHMEVTREAWRLDEHFQVSEGAIRELERQGHDVKRLQAILNRNTKDPPSLQTRN